MILIFSPIFVALIVLWVRTIRRKKVKSIEPFIAVLPGNQETAGTLNPQSPTWAYIKAWAIQGLNESRIANDSIKKNMEETSVMRGRIKLFKELIDLPDRPAKGKLPEYSEIELSNFAGY